MLPYRSHWRFAHNEPLTRERRLLAFANDNVNGPDPAAENAEEAATPNAAPDPVVQTGTSEIRQAVGQALREHDEEANSTPEQRAQEQQEAARTPDEQAKVIESKEDQQALTQQLQEIADESKKMERRIGEILKQMEHPDLVKMMNELDDPEGKQRWQDDIEFLKLERVCLDRDAFFAEELINFWGLDYHPDAFMVSLRGYLEQLPFGVGRDRSNLINGEGVGQAIANAIEHRLGDNMVQSDWDTLNESVKIELFEDFRKGMQLDSWIDIQKKRLKDGGAALNSYEQRIDAVERGLMDSQMEQKSGGSSISGIGGFMGQLRFHSVMDYVRGVKQYWESVTDTWDLRGKRHAAQIAAQIGKSLESVPFYGEEIRTNLDKKLEATRAEESGSMKEQLEKEHANWGRLFGDDGIFWDNVGVNQNKALGIIDYASAHGWLYEIDDDTAHPDHRVLRDPNSGKWITMKDICIDWVKAGEQYKVDNYYSDLRIANSKGRDSEMQAGYAKETDIENVPKFIELLEAELDDINLWTAAGICKRAMERGLEGEVSAWLLTTVMNKLRSNPKIKKSASVAFFDILGKQAMYKTAFSLGMFKRYRKDLRRWGLTGKDSILEEETELGILKVIEDDIKTKDPDTDYSSTLGQRDLLRKVAKVLATQTLELPGGKISIFESRFSSYRKMTRDDFITFEDPLKEDSDYYTNESEQLLLSFDGIDQVLAYSSTRRFEAPALAVAFLEKLIAKAKELRDMGLMEEYFNFVSETKAKLDPWMKSLKREKNLPILDLPSKKYSGLPIIAAVVAEGLIDAEIVKQGEYFKGQMEPQLKTSFAEFYYSGMRPPVLKDPNALPAPLKKSGSGAGSGAEETIYSGNA